MPQRVARAKRAARRAPRPRTCTAPELVFIDEFMRTMNATEAACRAYPNQARRSASTQGMRLLDRPHVVQELARRRERLMAKHEITRDRVLEELRRIAFANLDDVAAWGPDGVTPKPSDTLTPDVIAAVEQVESVPSEHGPRVKVKMHPKKAALDTLLQYLTPSPAEQRAGSGSGVQVILEGGPTGLEVPAGAQVRVTVAP